MKRIKLWKITIGLIVLIVIGFIVFAVENDGDKSTNEQIVVKDNVYVLDEDSIDAKDVVGVEESRIIFGEKVDYKTGDIIVSGVTEKAPYGFIRKVKDVFVENNCCVVETDYGVLTDVFEELHVEKEFILSEKGIKENLTEESNDSNKILALACAGGIANAMGEKKEDKVSEDESKYEFGYPLDYRICENISLSGDVGMNLKLEVKLDIEDEEVMLGIFLHNELGGVIALGCEKSEEMELFEKTLFSKGLPSIQFIVGGIPVVITNEMTVTAEGNVKIEGNIETKLELESSNMSGFVYSSKTDEVIEVKENVYLSDGIKWATDIGVSGEAKVGIYLHLTSKLYDSTGADIACGVEGNLRGNVNLKGIQYEGCLNMAIRPVLEGKIIVTIPVLDRRLTERTIFEVELPALWEKEWKSDENPIVKVQGDMQYIAYFTDSVREVDGNYTARGELLGMDYIPEAVLQDIEVGDVYILYGNEFRYEGLSSQEQKFANFNVYYDDKKMEYYMFSDENGEYYCIYTDPIEPGWNYWPDMCAYAFEKVRKESNHYSVMGSSCTTLSDDFPFVIKGDTIVKMCIAEVDGLYIWNNYTFEDCIKNDIRDYEGLSVEECMSYGTDVYFDEEGSVSYMRLALIKDFDLKSVKENLAH